MTSSKHFSLNKIHIPKQSAAKGTGQTQDP